MPSSTRITLDQLHDRRWELLALTSVGAFMAPLDGSIVAVALPKMGPALHLSFSASIWVQAAYLLAVAVLLIPLGRLADHHGRVRFYLAGVAIFTLGSLLAGAEHERRLADRQPHRSRAAARALLSATSTAIVTAVFPPQERGRALGINVMAVYVGLSIGPVLGGQIVRALGWRWIFFVNLPIGWPVLIWGWLLLPAARTRDRRQAPRPTCAGSLLLARRSSACWCRSRLRLRVGLGVAAHHRAARRLRVELRRLRGHGARVPRIPLLDMDLLLHNRLFAAANAGGAAQLHGAVRDQHPHGRSSSRSCKAGRRV